MIAVNNTASQVCRRLLKEFFAKYPNAQLQVQADRTLKKLLTSNIPMLGKPGGWAGGILYAISSIGVGVPGILNSELEKVVGVSMGTIYKRAVTIRGILIF